MKCKLPSKVQLASSLLISPRLIWEEILGLPIDCAYFSCIYTELIWCSPQVVLRGRKKCCFSLSLYENIEVVFYLECCKCRMGFTANDMLIYLGKWSRFKFLLHLLPGICPSQIGRNCLMFWTFWLMISLFL